ncbi:M3 family metallopeptidase [Longispora fulva]|uniref:Thimet oligopeptidase n=1 Tax=Longispora fulva TaxID=619741 RepID=A0A8J7GBQ8_9ACTN|nr:M3 family metallopeptidase [Longispora fulva]MBG6135564.1 thimet oligopeptidase [Longispora fulva]
MSHTPAATTLLTGTPDQLRTAAAQAIDTARTGMAAFVARAGGLPAVEAVELYDEARAALDNAQHVSTLIRQAHPDPELRAAAEATEQLIVQAGTAFTLDPAVYAALAALDLSGVDDPTRHLVTRALRDMRLLGVDRDEETRERIRELHGRLVGLGQAFGRNIAADTREAALDPAALAGLPADYVAAHPPGPDGRVTVTTNYPDLVPFLTYATDSAARESLWRLNRRRGHPANVAVLDDLLAGRHELATLLGFGTWADYVTANKMIGSELAAAGFVADVSAMAADRADRDVATLLERKRVDDPAAGEIRPWDIGYLTDRVRSERFAFDSRTVRPFFEYERVKAGLMAVAGRMFGIEFRARPDVPVWHPDVETFDVYEDGALLGRIRLDMFPRADKFSHAAMYRIVTGKRGVRTPECVLLCNFPRPAAEPALMQPSDVVTFFHEFGHLLHHVFCGQVRWSVNSGMAIERDFIEAPSQLLEEWVRDPATLATFATHQDTGAPIDAETVARMRAAEEFGKGLDVRQQMFYAALSLELHGGPDVDAVAVERASAERHLPYRYVEDPTMHLSFGHLDGYSAFVYTYMWSLVIAKDLMTAFDPANLLDPARAARYRAAVLAPGASAPAADLVRDLLGREFTFDAYRRWLDA